MTFGLENFQCEDNINKIHTCFAKYNLGNPNNAANGEYSLLNIDNEGKPTSAGTELENLLKEASTDMRVQIKNQTGNPNEWSTIIWKTKLYDLKQKKFKCTDLKYNEKTGRIKEIHFEEVIK